MYSKLENAQIRLLKIVAADNGSYHILLETHSLAQHSRPEYSALSYTWGRAEAEEFEAEPSSTETIEVELYHRPCDGGQRIALSRNLHDFFVQVVTAGDTFINRYYWVDAICINQSDHDEKAREISRMHEIYASAQTVVIWLGKWHYGLEKMARLQNMMRKLAAKCLAEGPNIPQALKDLGGLTDRNTLDMLDLPPETTLEDWKELALFYQRKWFSRVWTLQELAMGRVAVFVLGGHLIDPNIVRQCNAVIMLSSLQERLIRLVQVSYPSETRVAGVYFTATRDSAFSLVQESSPLITALTASVAGRVWTPEVLSSQGALALHLFRLLVGTRLMDATDARDRVYAFIGLIATMALQRGLTPPELPVDYTRSLAQVMTNTMAYILTETQCLGLLAECQDRSFSTVRDLPSWVPDWTSPTPQPFLSVLAVHAPDLAASVDVTARLPRDSIPGDPVRISAVDGTLHLKTLCIGRVVCVGNSHHELSTTHDIRATVGLLLYTCNVTSPDPAAARESVIAFHTLLLADLPDLCAKLASQHGTLARAFHQFWLWQGVSYIAVHLVAPGYSRAKCLRDLETLDELVQLADPDGTTADPYFPTTAAIAAHCDALGLLEDCYENRGRDLVAEMLTDIREVDSALRRTMQLRRTFLLERQIGAGEDGDAGNVGVAQDGTTNKGSNVHKEFVFGMAAMDARVGDECHVLGWNARMPMLMREVEAEPVAANVGPRGRDSAHHSTPVVRSVVSEAYVPAYLFGVPVPPAGFRQLWREVMVR